jgi:DUF4097 and DUF4098 domain-containing protein YvlB
MPSFETPQPVAIDAELSVGSVHVIASERTDSTVAVTPADPTRDLDIEAAERADVELVDGSLVVRATTPRRLGRLLGPNGRTGAVDLVMEVPTGSSLRIGAPVADVRTDGTLGDVEVTVGVGELRLDRTHALRAKTSGGDVTVRRATGDVRVTGSGELRLHTVDGSADVKNLSGPVWIGDVGGPLRARSSSGHLVVDRARDEVTARTASGDISVGEIHRGTVALTTAAGRVDVGVAHGTAVRIEAASKFGRIRNQLETTDGPEDAAETAELQARTSYGDITVHRSEVR